MSKRFCALALMAWALGCGPMISATRSGPKVRSKANRCPFELSLEAGARPYTKLAVLQVEAFSPRRLPTKLDKLRPLIAPYVCQAGGNGALATRDGHGRFVLVRVVHFGDAASLLPPPSPSKKLKKQSKKKGKA